jgi:hypothetical protein
MLRKKKELSIDYVIKRSYMSSVDIATGYGLNGPGIESRW